MMIANMVFFMVFLPNSVMNGLLYGYCSCGWRYNADFLVRQGRCKLLLRKSICGKVMRQVKRFALIDGWLGSILGAWWGRG